MLTPDGTPQCRYLDLLELALTGALNNDPPNDPWHPAGQFDAGTRKCGLDWPLTAPTMIGLLRIRQLREAVEMCLREDVPGDFIETGVWRGGACIMMAGVLQAYGASSRQLFVADSFEGLPPPSVVDDKSHAFPQLAVSLNEVANNFVRYGLLSDQIIFVPGWFNESLPKLPTERLALLRLDGDMYESTRDGLMLYSKLSSGGFCIVDDYFAVKACRRAIDEFRTENGITIPLVDIDGKGVFWRKP